MKATFNFWLVALSVAIAMIASYLAIIQARRLWRAQEEESGKLGVLGVAVAAGTGVWTMHFIGMMAFHLPIPLSYDLGLTLLSYGFSFLGSFGAFRIANHAHESRRKLLPGTLMMSFGIVAMHYSGMYALRMDPPIRYDPLLFAVSIAIALAASYTSLWLAFCASKAFDSWGRITAASVFMGAAISGMHYTSMIGARFHEHARSLAAPLVINQNDLAIITTCGSFLIIAQSLMFSIVSPLFSLSRLIALILLGELAIMGLLEHLTPFVEGYQWAVNVLDAVLLTLFLSPLLWRLRRDSLSLAYERARASTALASIGDGVVVTDGLGCVEYLNDMAEKLTGWSLAEARGKDLDEVFNIVGEDGLPTPIPVGECIRLNRIVNLGFTNTLVRRDGVRFGVEDSAAPIQDGKGKTTGAVLVIRDVTAKRKVVDELNLAASVFSHAAEGIVITDRNAQILRVNKAFCTITGYTPNEVVGRNPRILSSGKQDKAFYHTMWEKIEKVGEWQGEVWNQRKNGEIYPEWLSIRAIFSDRGHVTHYVGIFSDISERVRDQEYIFRLAYYDSLTEVANRALLMDHLEIAISQAHRHRMSVAVLFIDMDRFKLINDSLGHGLGDLLLQNVAQALIASVREGDTVSRFGGDEFVVCLPDVAGERSDAVRDSLKVAEKIQRRLTQPFNLQGHEVVITPSIGVALYPWDGETPGILIKHADTAMYHAKSQGRDNVQLFAEQMLTAGSERLRIQSALRKALENGEFMLHYQAQIELSTGRIIGAEALLRWHNPDLGWVEPSKFIPIAEDTSLILPIGKWVLQQVCRDLLAWKEKRVGFDSLPRIALNFSPRQFIQPDFVGAIMRQLNEFGIQPACMEVEITEATLMHNTELALSALKQLRDLGICIAVDDFGVGYSSLGYLKRFPIDVLKIDQSFVRDIGTDSNDAQIVRAIIAMGHSLNLIVLAEGVETREQLEFLKGEGCQAAQGYLFSRPLPADEFIALFSQGGQRLAASLVKARGAAPSAG